MPNKIYLYFTEKKQNAISTFNSTIAESIYLYIIRKEISSWYSFVYTPNKFEK